MSATGWFQLVLLLVVLAITVPPLGRYLAAVYDTPADGKAPGERFFGPIDRFIYRIAVLDAPFGKSPSDMRTVRGKLDSTRAALYYPGVMVANPLAGPKSAAKAELLQRGVADDKGAAPLGGPAGQH